MILLLWFATICKLLPKLGVSQQTRCLGFVVKVFCMVFFSEGCPTILRCDYGTENVAMAVVQTAFRLQHHDCLAGAKSFMYGPPTGNFVRIITVECVRHNYIHSSHTSQRIESWWSQFRRHIDPLVD